MADQPKSISDVFYQNSLYQSIKESEIFNEYYIGKNKYMIELERLIHNARALGLKNTKAVNNINKSKEMLELDLFMERTFGFKICNFGVITLPTQNAFTYIPIGSGIDYRSPEKYIHADKDRVYYDKKAEYSVMIFVFDEIFFNSTFTDAEVVAALLHELGHNFQYAMSPTSNGLRGVENVLILVSLPFEVLADIASGKTGNAAGAVLGTVINYTVTVPAVKNGIVEALRAYRNSYPNAFDNAIYYIRSILCAFGGLGSLIGKLSSYLMSIVNPIGTIIRSAMSGVISLVSGITSGIGYRQENIADNFATLFGYGPELSSFLEKLADSQGNVINKSLAESFPFIENYSQLLQLPYTIMASCSNPQPQDSIRYVKQVEYLKKELLKEDLSPRMRKELTDQINRIEKLVAKCSAPEGFMSDSRFCGKLLNSMHLFIMNLPFSRNKLFGDGVYEEFDKLYIACQKDKKKG